MRNLTIIFALILGLFGGLQAQTILSEDFEDGALPAGWTVETNATDGGWIVGTPATISSSYWNVPSNGSSQVAATNDDACDCDKSEDYLILPVMDFSDVPAAVLRFDSYFEGGSYQGNDEVATVEISTDGINWTVAEDMHGHGYWDTHVVDISALAGEATAYVAFRYNDDGGWLFGFAIDNVSVEEPLLKDARMVELDYRPFGEEETFFPIKGTILNEGATTITDLAISYTVNGQFPTAETLTGLNIEPFSYYTFDLTSAWLPQESGVFEVAVTIGNVNGSPDENPDNNSLAFETEIYPKVIPPNRMAEFLAGDPVSITVATSADQLDKPNDLDFFPIMAKDEVWIVNERTENTGGSTLTVYGANEDNPEFEHRVDGNAWHFMSLPTGIAFGENFFWATSPGVQDANHSGGTFTGPTLWSSDPDIYAQPSGGNGSHMDMLHGSPYSMGIAHEVDNVYWVFDGWNETIVRYDFVEDHGPGNDDHSDAIVRRYLEISVERDGSVPSHMVLDKETGWMYIVDNGNDRVLRLDINSGNVVGNLPLINEPLAEHSEMGGVTWEVLLENLDRPCGIEVIENRLLVGEYETGEILVYDMDNGFEELGRIQTGAAGLTGIKVGPYGNIWYTNKLQNTLVKLEPGVATTTEQQDLSERLMISPNPASDQLFLSLPGEVIPNDVQVEILNVRGQSLRTLNLDGYNMQIPVADLASGIYTLRLQGEGLFAVKRFVVQK